MLTKKKRKVRNPAYNGVQNGDSGSECSDATHFATISYVLAEGLA